VAVRTLQPEPYQPQHRATDCANQSQHDEEREVGQQRQAAWTWQPISYDVAICDRSLLLRIPSRATAVQTSITAQMSSHDTPVVSPM
jgi:hypothetical protein